MPQRCFELHTEVEESFFGGDDNYGSEKKLILKRVDKIQKCLYNTEI